MKKITFRLLNRALHDKNRFANDTGLRTIFFLYFFFRLLSPPFTRQWNPGRYYQVTRAPRPGQPQFLINYYILFFIQYILVSRSAFQARQRNGRLFEGEYSRITTVTLPRTSCLRNLEPPMFASLFFSLFGHAFSRFSRRPTPPVLSLFLVLVQAFNRSKKQHFDSFEQTAAHQHAAAAGPTVCAALYPVHGESTNHWFHSAGVGPHAVNL